MAKSKTVRVSEEELALLTELRAKKTVGEREAATAPSGDTTTGHQELANALITAIESTREKPKRTIANRVKNTPWQPAGTPKVKMKREFYQHGIPVTKVTNEEIELLNKVRPGNYCEGFVKVRLRQDRGIDIDYPVKTASQRLKLVNQFGVRSFAELLQRLIDEHANPKKYRRSDDMDLFEDVEP